MDKQRWTYYAMYGNIINNSTYYKQINKIRNEIGFRNYTTKNKLGKYLNTYFLKSINNKITQAQLPINKIEDLTLHKQLLD